MQCSSPLKALARIKGYGFDKPDFWPTTRHAFFALHNITWNSPALDDYCKHAGLQKLLVPCGQCFECRMNNAKEWAARVTLESSLYSHNYFFTLTYDDDHLPPKYDDSFPFNPLDFNDMQLFIKRLRDHFWRDFGLQIRTLYCGEYGDQFSRPHYHLIVLNGPSLDQLQASLYRSKPYLMYDSPYIRKIWAKGWCPFEVAQFNTIAYVCRYVLKKYKGSNADVYYSSLGLEAEDRRASRRPGLGRPWIEQHLDIYDADGRIVVPTGSGSFCMSAPRYFDDVYLQCGGDPARLWSIKCKRQQNAEFLFDEELSHTTLKREAYLAVKHDNLLDRLSCLKNRDLNFHP